MTRDTLQKSTRRRFLGSVGAGLGLAGATNLRHSLALAGGLGDGQLLAPRPTHFAPKATRLVVLFLNGGFSHVDTFDYKPELQKNNDKVVSAEELFYKFDGKLLSSPFRFSRFGQSGLWISDLFPHLSTVADDLCVIRTVHSDLLEHFQASLQMHTGSATLTLPGVGAWISYGLGTLNQNLPSHIVLAKKKPYAGAQTWDNSFLPPEHQGVRIIPGKEPIANLKPSTRSVTLRELEQIMLRDLNEKHAGVRHDARLRARTASYRVAGGMMREAPPLFDLSKESPKTRDMYGLKADDNTSFAYQCLVARRMVEAGVRVIEVVDSGGGSRNWDAHGNIFDHRRNAKDVDQAMTAFIQDLKQRGLFDETLVVICTEFGRTPWRQHNSKTPGRNHWHKAFTCLLTGAGVKGGTAYGETDQWGAYVAENPVHVHDFHATILHLLGLDHTRLTYRYSGRDFRLTDVYGKVVGDVLT